MADKKYLVEERGAKWFVRGITGVVLLAYMYRIVSAVVTKQALAFDSQDWTIMFSSVSIWLVFEAVVAFIKRRLDKKGNE